MVWFRLFDDHFGATALTFALVLCGFIGGLGVGALCSECIAARVGRVFRLTDRLRIYGAIELLVSLTALLTMAAMAIPADLWGGFPYELSNDIYESTAVRQWSRVGIALLCVLLPCILMGATYPLLCATYPFHDGDEQAGAAGRRRFPAALYAWNTLGAGAGVLVCHFVLLRTIGHHATYGLMIGLNALIGAFFIWQGGQPESETTATRGEIGDGETNRTSTGMCLTFAILGGLLTGALEGDALKRVWFWGGTSGAAMAFVSFWSILAIFLGAFAVRVLPRLGWVGIKVMLVVGAAVYFFTCQNGYAIRQHLIDADLAAVREAMASHAITEPVQVRFQSGLAQVLWFTGIVVFPAMFAFSMVLPFVCTRLHAAGRRVGMAYGLNTLAFCAGLVAFTLVAPRVNAFFAFKSFFAMLGVAVVLAVVLFERSRWNGWACSTAAVGVVVACFLTPTDFDADMVLPGSPPSQARIHELRSNGSHTTYVVARAGGATLYFDNHPMSSTARPAQTYMRLMAHVPLLLHERPRKALLIGFGVGNTASAIAAHESIEQIDVVELNRNVLETAPFFSIAHNRVHRDHRVRMILDDGRTFLRLTDQHYDLITSEPPPPMQAGVHRLYSRQYYQDARDHLTERGFMSHWLPAYQMPTVAVHHVVTTFTEVFPHTMLITGYGREFVLIGSRSPIDLRLIESRFRSARGAELDLQRIGVKDPAGLLARIVQTDGSLRKQFSAGRVIDDARNDLLTLFADPARPTAMPYASPSVLEWFDQSELASGDHMRGILTHAGRLRYHVPDFPRDVLSVMPDDAGVWLADADWRRLDNLRRQAASARARGLAGEAIALLKQSLDLQPQQPLILMDLARLYFETQQFEAALRQLESLVAIEPNDVAARHAMTDTLIALHRFDKALEQADHCVALQPDRADLHILRAGLLVQLNRIPEAIEAYDQALQLDEFSLEAKTKRDALLNR